MWRIKEYDNKYIYDRIQYIRMYTLAIGFCIAVLRGEWLTKGCIRFYRGLIAVNLIAIAVFIENVLQWKRLVEKNN